MSKAETGKAIFLEEATVETLQRMMDDGDLTSFELVMGYLERIAAYDKSGPRLNSVLEINPDALHIAEAMDRERARKGPRGPLHGIPVLLKDNIDTGDKMHTSAGSLALAGSYAPEDSFVARRLREEGAVILGKANMTEWANFMTDNMPNGYSSRGGQVLNPYGPGKHDVGGSSSGSAAAVAANLVTLAVGTETSGSILNPASANSIVGIKPTVGLISRSGIIPIAHSQDTAGPLARTVTDAAILLGALVGVDARDPATWSSEGRYFRDYTQFLHPDGLKGSRLGIPRSTFEKLGDDRLPLMDAALEALKDAGAELVDIEMPEAPKDITVLTYEFKSDLNAYLRRLDPSVPIHSLKELIEFNEKDPERMLKYGQTLLVASEKTSGTLTEPEYITARARDLYMSRTFGIDRILSTYRLDAIVFPHVFGAAIAAKAGYPSITVPAGYTQAGRPMGITFTAGAYSEPILIRLAYAFEQVTKHRRPPKLE
ncbi:MAG: amidase [Candidatus Fermentithermobacillus carboniphilus]|uniref:Amidase n=1 Tax=Candidatus Fermentithermobacillus carboniphilus TaxID=3085328 RepID=A0AAT9LE85_9FIRM|nr:MAG: amidase [Candidatus Fermentithermobacillus carboniphilus]